MSTPTPTPRVDKEAYDCEHGFIDGKPHMMVEADFARQLETELAASQAREAALTIALCNLVDAVRDAQDWSETRVGDAVSGADIVLLNPAPPVVPLAVAQQLAEALEELRSYYFKATNSPAQNANLALAAFAPYKP